MSKKALPIILILFLILVGIIGVMVILKSEPGTAVNEPSIVNKTNVTLGVTEIPQAGNGKTEQVANTTTITQGKIIPLTLISPIEKTIVNNPNLVVKGVTAPNAEVYINDTKTAANSDGNFTGTITLDEGENYIVMVVNDSDGNSAEKDFYITLNTL